MTDTELNELLDQWAVPPERAAFQEGLRAGYIAKLPPNRPPMHSNRILFRSGALTGMVAGAAIGAVVFFSVVARAFPQAFDGISLAKVPYAVESNDIVYAKNGASRVETVLQSYSYKGTEVILDETAPGNLFRGAVRGILAGMNVLMLRFAPGLLTRAESRERDAWFGAWVRSGCVHPGETVVGHDTILNYSTVIVQRPTAGGKLTYWLAPDLGCFALRLRNEKLLSGNRYQLTTERNAVKVIMGCRTRAASGACVERYTGFPFQ